MSLCKTCTNDRCVIEEGKIIDKCAEYREKSDTEKIKALFDQVAENAKNETVILRAETFDRLRNDLADVIKERDKYKNLYGQTLSDLQTIQDKCTCGACE